VVRHGERRARSGDGCGPLGEIALETSAADEPLVVAVRRDQDAVAGLRIRRAQRVVDRREDEGLPTRAPRSESLDDASDTHDGGSIADRGCEPAPADLDCRPPPRQAGRPIGRPQEGILSKPTRQEAEEAVRTLLRWIGDDPNREGLRGTPSRVVSAYEDWFSGYNDDPVEFLRRTFYEVDGYDEMVVLRDISFESHCEHHMAPITGKVHVGYLPDRKVVGISKLARVVEAFSRRL